MVSNIGLGIILRMTATCLASGIVLGGLFGGALICSLVPPIGVIPFFQGIYLGMSIGGILGLVFGLVSGIVMARTTMKEKLYEVNAISYKQSMEHLSQSVVIAGVLIVSVLSAGVTLPEYGWEAWLIGTGVFIPGPGLIAFFTFRWASKRVAEWVMQNVNKA